MSKSKYNLNYSLLIGIFVFSIILVCRDILLFKISDAILILVLFLIMASLKYKQLVYFIFFVFPFTCGIPGYSMTLSLIMLISKNLSLTKKQVVPFLIIGLLEIINFSLYGNIALSTSVISFLSFTAIFFYFWNLKNTNIENHKCVFMFSIGSCIVISIILYNMIKIYGIDNLLTGQLRTGAMGIEDNDIEKMKGHIALNANSLAYYAIATLSSVVVLYNKFKNYSYAKYILPALLIIAFFGGILSFSRTFLITLVLFFALYFLIINKKQFVVSLLLLVIGFCVTSYYLPGFFEAIVGVFEDRSDSLATAGGRLDIFPEYNSRWSSNILYIILGCSVCNHMEVLHMTHAIHCGAQQIWVSLGVIGFITYTYVGVNLIRKGLQFYKNYIFCLPLLITIIFDQSIQSLNPYPLILPILSVAYILKSDNQKTI